MRGVLTSVRYCIFKYSKKKKQLFESKNMSQYYCCYCILDQINSGLLSKNVIVQNFFGSVLFYRNITLN